MLQTPRRHCAIASMFSVVLRRLVDGFMPELPFMSSPAWGLGAVLVPASCPPVLLVCGSCVLPPWHTEAWHWHAAGLGALPPFHLDASFTSPLHHVQQGGMWGPGLHVSGNPSVSLLSASGTARHHAQPSLIWLAGAGCGPMPV